MKTMTSDLEIHERAVSELDWDARFEPGELGVEVDDGIVTLRGTVSTYAKVRAAADVVALIPGVRAVVNELVVRPRPRPHDDLTIAARVRAALDMQADVPSAALEVFVRNGHVTIRGPVDHAYQRMAAEDAVAQLDGVRGLAIEIEVRGHTRTDADIARDLADALRRRMPWATDVAHQVSDGTVTLSGIVPGLGDRIAAEVTAWRTRGVRHVIDRVRVMRA